MIRFGQGRRRTMAQVKKDKLLAEAAVVKAKEDAEKAAQFDAMKQQLDHERREVAAALQFRDEAIAQGLFQFGANNTIELTSAAREVVEVNNSQRAASEQLNESGFYPAAGDQQEEG